MRHRADVIVCSGLGVLTLIALAIAHLALTDIARGEGDLAAEWMAVRGAFAVMGAFLLSAAVVLRRAWAAGGEHG